MGGEGNTRKIIIKTKAGLILENQLNPLISELGTAADLLQEVWNEYLCQTLWTDRINDNSCTCSKFSYACKCHDDSFLNIHFKEKSEWLHVLVCILKQEMLNIQIHHTSIFLKGSWLWKEMQTVVVKSATPPHPHPPPPPATNTQTHNSGTGYTLVLATDTQLRALPKCWLKTLLHGSLFLPGLQGKLELSLLP